MDTRDELIAEQQLTIRQLGLELNSASSRLREIHGLLICIGGPLNDNRERYSKAQRVIFHKIESLCSGLFEE